jgi:hypothetical protein
MVIVKVDQVIHTETLTISSALHDLRRRPLWEQDPE